MSSGIKVLDPRTGKAAYDTSNPRLQIAINRDPPHLDRPVVTPTAIVTNAGNNFTAREVLYEIKHGLGYKPRVLIYFLRSGTNRYDIGKSFFGFGTVDDYMKYEIDETWFRIVHQVDDFFQIGFTSIATGTVACKFMIFSNPADNYTDPNRRE